MTAGSDRPLLIWGVNYDHDDAGRLLEDYWLDEWSRVEEDFGEIRALGANCVRVHLQFAKLMASKDSPSPVSLERLARLLRLAEESGLYLDITGLGCYHARDVPRWYDLLDEGERWAAQARFWEAVAEVCKSSPAVLCYDLMNEPILPGDRPESEWLAGEFDGKRFVQRITLDLAGRPPRDVARAWLDRLVSAIRGHDARHLITVGVIPWLLTFPGATPLFYTPEVAARLDFVSLHVYPRSGQLEETLAALKAYDIGKPILIEELFPLACSMEEVEEFIDRSRPRVAGWMSFYWGKTAAQYAEEAEAGAEDRRLRSAVLRAWLERFRAKSFELLGGSH